MMKPYRTAKFKSANIFVSAALDQFKDFRLYGIVLAQLYISLEEVPVN